MRVACAALCYLGILLWITGIGTVLLARRRARQILDDARDRAFEIEEKAIIRARRLVLTAAKVALRLPPDLDP